MSAFTTTFPRGFAVEILKLNSGPPVIAYKFRHWGYMEGPFKGYPPAGEKGFEFFGVPIFQRNSSEKFTDLKCQEDKRLHIRRKGAQPFRHKYAKNITRT